MLQIMQLIEMENKKQQTFCKCVRSCTVVGRKEHERVTFDLQFTEFVKNLTNTSIQLHHRITIPDVASQTSYKVINMSSSECLVDLQLTWTVKTKENEDQNKAGKG